MNNDLLFDFNVDKTAKMVYITREFNAGLSLVWDAVTKAELPDLWAAPAPMRAKCRYMNFEPGGRRFYAMIGPGRLERWTVQKFTPITPKTNLKMYNTFADKYENRELPDVEWDYNFGDRNGITKVDSTIFNESFERLEKLWKGFSIGFAMCLINLEERLATLL